MCYHFNQSITSALLIILRCFHLDSQLPRLEIRNSFITNQTRWTSHLEAFIPKSLMTYMTFSHCSQLSPTQFSQMRGYPDTGNSKLFGRTIQQPVTWSIHKLITAFLVEFNETQIYKTHPCSGSPFHSLQPASRLALSSTVASPHVRCVEIFCTAKQDSKMQCLQSRYSERRKLPRDVQHH